MRPSLTSVFLVFVLFHLSLLCYTGMSFRVTAGTQVRSNSSLNVRIVKNCFPGTYIKIDCKMYFDCTKDGHFRRNFCDHGTYWNHRDKKCDEIQNIPECVTVYASKPENPIQAVMPQLSSTSSSPATTIDNAPGLIKSTVPAKKPFSIEPASEKFRSLTAIEATVVKNDKLHSSSTESPVSSTTARRNVNQLEGEEDDYIDPPNTDWDIDGVLGLDAGSGRSDISEDTGNDIITDDTKQTKDVFEKDDFLEVNKADSETPVFQPVNADTHGKTCILRGKEKVCTPVVNSALPPVYTNQIFSKQTTNTEGTPSPPPPTTTEPTPPNSNCSQSSGVASQGNDIIFTSTKPISFDFSLHLGVQDSAIRFVRIIAYYVNFTIIAWRTT